jgi:hypothetical protein
MTTAITRRSKIGRPTKYVPATVRKVLRAVERGLPLKLAAAHGGIAFETFCVWRTRYPDFAQAVEQALAKSVRHHLSVIENAASQGDWKAASWLLEHRFPEHFARNRIELQHIGQVVHEFAVPREVLDKIADARRATENEGD